MEQGVALTANPVLVRWYSWYIAGLGQFTGTISWGGLGNPVIKYGLEYIDPSSTPKT